ncbi:MAG: glycosyltransferase family A protein [Patescibacteria group bacterium]
MNKKHEFSIIIPTFNRRKRLCCLLGQLNLQKYPKKLFEVIVVDNGSSDGTRDVIRLFKIKTELRIIFINAVESGPSFARNLGLRKAKNQKVVLIDDDCEVASDFLIRYSNSWNEHKKFSLIGGKVVSGLTVESNNKKLIAEFPWCFGLYDLPKSRELQLGEHLLSSNMSIDRTLCKNKFSEKFGVCDNKGNMLVGTEDYEFCTKAILDGSKVFFDKKISVKNCYDLDRLNYVYIIKRHWRAGKENALLDSEIFKTKLVNHFFKFRFKDGFVRIFLSKSLWVFINRFIYFFSYVFHSLINFLANVKQMGC